MASEGLRVKSVPSGSLCLVRLEVHVPLNFLDLGAEPGFGLLYSTFTYAFKKKPAPPSVELYRKNGEIKCGCAPEPGRMESPKSASQKGASSACLGGGAGGIFGSPELCRETEA